jgi:Ricin-type beta-trefoil lectin domain/Lysozyme like domain
VIRQSAAGRCATWAADAGFPNDGYLAGSLTTSVAIALAESGCNPSACFDNTTRAACTPPINDSHNVDRGAWQLNNKVKGATSDRCAFNGPCSARAAYLTESNLGTFFYAWVTYQLNTFTRFIPAAQDAVNSLTAGAVASGLDGSCLGYPADKAGAAARLANCSATVTGQVWTIRGATLRTGGGRCLTAGSRSRSAPVVLRRCNGSALQQWLARSHAALYNPAARRCLNDPGSADRPGAVIDDSACTGLRNQTWFRP